MPLWPKMVPVSQDVLDILLNCCGGSHCVRSYLYNINYIIYFVNLTYLR